MLDLKIYEVSLQTILIDQRNLQREPSLVDEPICDEKEIQELHILLQSAIAEFGSRFDRITFSGLKSLFDSVGLNSDFLAEDSRSLNPGKDLVSQERPGPKRPPNEIYDLPPLPPEVKRYPTSPMQCPNVRCNVLIPGQLFLSRKTVISHFVFFLNLLVIFMKHL